MGTPIGIVTGFLGSGKTTLIGQVLRDPGYARTAVVVNEFGEIGLDHALVAAGDETLLQLTTGCLCCAVRTDLVATLLELEGRRAAGEIGFERVLVETSGLADPAPILHALMTDAGLAGRFSLAAVTTLVDAVLGERTLVAYPEARRQVAFADRLVVTKTDVAPASEGLLAALAGWNALAPVVMAVSGEELFAGGSGRLPEDAVARHTAGVGACVIRRIDPVPALAVTLLLQALAEQCGEKLLRLKGLVDLLEAPGRPAVVHAVQHVIAPVSFLDAWPSEPGTRMVVIGMGIPRFFPARLFDAIVGEVTEEIGLL